MDEGTSVGAASDVGAGADGGAGMMRTGMMRGEVARVEALVLGFARGRLEAQRTVVQSAVSEDGRVASLQGLRIGDAFGTRLRSSSSSPSSASSPSFSPSLPPSPPSPASVSAWRQLVRVASHHADVDWRDTLRNGAVCLALARFSAHGPVEAAILAT